MICVFLSMSLKRHANRHELLDRRRALRQDQTFAERSLWSQLRGSKHGVKFSRQHSKGNFILDFFAPQINLAIEVDGATHDDPSAKDKEAWRQSILEAEGIIFLRFTDAEVLHDANRTMQCIDAKISELLRAV